MDSRFAAAPRRVELILAAALLLASVPAAAQERELGMEVIGDRQVPKALIIVPWKSPRFGSGSGQRLQSLIGDSLAPIEPDGLRRELRLSATARRAADAD